MPIQPSACFFDCPDACGMLVETDDAGHFQRLRGNPKHSWSAGVLCAKTSWYGDVVESPDRILTPHRRNARGKFEACSWDDALEIIAERLGKTEPARILSLDYAGNMGVLGRRFPRRIMNGLGATFNDGTICDSTAEAGYSAVLGHAIGFDMEETESCDGIILWGCDPVRTSPHLLPRLKRAMAAGARVTVIDIYGSDTVQWVKKLGGSALIIRPGTDAALALGLAQMAFESRRADLKFLKREAVGAAEFRAHLTGRYSLTDVAEITGVGEDELRALVEWWHGAQQPLLKIGVGVARRRVGGMTMRAITSYAAVLGIADRVHWESGDHFDLDLGDLEGCDLRPKGSNQPPISLVQLGRELATKRFQASVVWGHNPAVTVPDSRSVRQGLSDPDHFLVVHELFWTATAKLADVVLPATTFLEQPDILRSYGHRVLQYVPRILEPRGETRGNLDAFAAIGKALGLPEAVWAGSTDDWCERILESNRGRFDGAEWDALLKNEPVKLRLPEYADRGTPSGKVELFSAKLQSEGLPPMAEYTPDPGAGGDGDFWLWPVPSKATHNSTFLHSKRHLARMGEPQVDMHPEDGQRLGLNDGDSARVFNDVGSLTLKVALQERVPKGAVMITGFLNEEQVPESNNVNALVASETSDLGGGSGLYSSRVSVEAVAVPGNGGETSNRPASIT